MANQEHFAKIQEGVAAWNAWRESHSDVKPDLNRADLREADLREADLRWAHLRGANLSGANLTGARFRLANLREADLREADFSQADLREAHLRGARLRFANLSKADLRFANLREADLNGADLRGANLRFVNLNRADLNGADLSEAHFGGADLSEADLRGAHLRLANLSGVDLREAHLSEANFAYAQVAGTAFGDVDLSTAKGLDSVQHAGPSTIGIDTVYKSKGRIPEVFLRSAGVPDTFITFMHSLAGGPPIQFYSCFISYSSEDEAIAERLNSDLRSKNLRCWFAAEDLKIGDRFQERIEDSIRLYDKVMILLSESSVKSRWVEREVNAAREREDQENRIILFPIRIDEAVMEAKQPWAADIRRQRHIGDFCRWKEHDAYQKSFTRLLRDLQQDDKANKT